MSRISRATTSPETYSARPWPNGWSRSAFFSASWNPASVMTDEPASLMLFKPSANMDREPVIFPKIILPADMRTLRNMPRMLASFP